MPPRHAFEVDGEALQRARRRASVGLTELADHTGISAGALIELERDGWRQITPIMLRRILGMLDCSFLEVGRIVPAPRRSEPPAPARQEASQ